MKYESNLNKLSIKILEFLSVSNHHYYLNYWFKGVIYFIAWLYLQHCTVIMMMMIMPLGELWYLLFFKATA